MRREASQEAVSQSGILSAGSAPRRYGRIALVGNPNVGKSVIFGALTGSYATVSNYPGTTVEIARAPLRTDAAVELIDTPGVHGLTPHSEDERVTRDILLAGVDGVVQIVDAKNLARGLAVSLQLAEAGVPFLLVVNMVDEAAERGMRVDTQALSEALGVPVLATVAVTGRGIAQLRAALGEARPSAYRVRYDPAIERAVTQIEGTLGGFPLSARVLALMCLAGDATLRDWLQRHISSRGLAAIEDAYRQVASQLSTSPPYEISRCRAREAEKLARAVTKRSEADFPASERSGRWEALGGLAFAGAAALLAGDLGVLPRLAGWPWRAVPWAAVGAAALGLGRWAGMRTAFGQWACHPRFGFAVLFVVLYVIYRFVGAFAAGTAVDFLENGVFGSYLNPVAVAVFDRVAGAAAQLGPAVGAGAAFLRDLLVGPYGLITVALTYAFAIILPIVSAFFLAFSLLEDSGYLPRLAVVVNRLFRGMGLNGKAVLPMVLGLGCDTMATLTARIMETRKERLVVTLLLALGVPCSAQLGLILGLFGALPVWAPAVWGVTVLGVLLAVGFLATRLLPGDTSDLILEIPPIRRPHLRNILLKTAARLEWYVREAVPIFVLGTFALFILDRLGVLSLLIRAGEPAVVGFLQLPARTAEAFLVGFFRRDYGAAGIYALFRQGELSPVQAVVALVTITLFVPCVANFFVIIKEHGLRTAVAMSAFIFPFAFLVGGAINAALRAAGLR